MRKGLVDDLVIASTNPLERLDKEGKRRADVVGIFPNDKAIIRLAGALRRWHSKTSGPWRAAT